MYPGTTNEYQNNKRRFSKGKRSIENNCLNRVLMASRLSLLHTLTFECGNIIILNVCLVLIQKFVECISEWNSSLNCKICVLIFLSRNYNVLFLFLFTFHIAWYMCRIRTSHVRHFYMIPLFCICANYLNVMEYCLCWTDIYSTNKEGLGP